MNRDLQGFIGHLDELSERASSDPFGDNKVTSFEEDPAGMVVDTSRTWWNGETEAVWMDGLVRMAWLTQDTTTMAKVDAYMNHILDNKDEDGYIGIYTPASRYRHPKENGELWTQSRIFVAMLAYYEATGRVEILEAVQKAAQLTMSQYGPGRSYFQNPEPAGGVGHGLMFVDAMEWLYRITGDGAYKDFGLFCYEDYCHSEKIRDRDNQLKYLLNMKKPFLWHAPHTMEHLRVPLWLYLVTGKPEYSRAFKNAFAKTQQYLVPSGACIGDENIKGRKPAPNLPYEYCAMTELLTSVQSALAKTGHARYAELAENVALNAAQGARFADGKAISYLTRDNRTSATRMQHRGKFAFSPTHEQAAVCCNPNAGKLMPYYVNRMWMRKRGTEKGLAAVIYGPCSVAAEIDGVAVRIEEVTDYPFSEIVRFVIYPDREVEFVLVLRNPHWSDKTQIAVSEADVKRDGDYHIIRKIWKSRDEVTLTFQAEVRPITAANDEVALRRGPLLYAMPIPEQRRITKTYALAVFHDYDIVPAPSAWPPVEKFARIDSGLGQRNWAKPQGKFDPAFAHIAVGRYEPIRYRMKAAEGKAFTVVFGLCEGWHKKPGERVLNLKIENKTRQTVDMIAEKGHNAPALFAFEARDENADGWLDIEVQPAARSPDTNAVLNVLWILAGSDDVPLDELLTGLANPRVLVRENCGPEPGAVSRWDYRLDAEQRANAFGFVYDRNPDADMLNPWAESPLRLNGPLIKANKREPVSLVPIGCTTLRRVTFPVGRDN
jgi:DUF1680 family protein